MLLQERRENKHMTREEMIKLMLDSYCRDVPCSDEGPQLKWRLNRIAYDMEDVGKVRDLEEIGMTLKELIKLMLDSYCKDVPHNDDGGVQLVWKLDRMLKDMEEAGIVKTELNGD